MAEFKPSPHDLEYDGGDGRIQQKGYDDGHCYVLVLNPPQNAVFRIRLGRMGGGPNDGEHGVVSHLPGRRSEAVFFAVKKRNKEGEQSLISTVLPHLFGAILGA